MKKRNGFVLLETIVVTTVLGIVLLSAYPSFLGLLTSMESTNTYDNVDYLYRTKSYNNTLNEEFSSSENIKVLCEGNCTNTLYDVKGVYLVNQTKINDIIKNGNIYISTKRYLKYLSKNTKKRSDTTSPLLVIAYKNENEPDSDNFEYASIKYTTEEERAFAIEEKSELHFEDIPNPSGKETLINHLYSLAKNLNQQKPYSSKGVVCTTDLYNNESCKGEVYYDITSDHNLRMSGEANYIIFNDEKWRIIGIMTNVDNGKGKKEERVKIVRDSYLPNLYSWDTSKSGENGATGNNGVNDWTQADLMKELNDETNGYLINKNGKDSWFNDVNNKKTKDNYDQNWGLKSSAKNLIDDAVWYLGSVYAPASNFWAGNHQETIYACNDSPLKAYTRERSDDAINITKKVGLIYASDYGFSVFVSQGWKDKMYGHYTSSFLNKGTSLSATYHYGDYYNLIGQSNKIYTIKTSYVWTISRSLSNKVIAISASDGATGQTPFYGRSIYTTTYYEDEYNYTTSIYVKPAVYLKANVLYKSGDGTEDDPFVIGLN